MLQNAYLLAKIGADTAENERHFAENLPKIGDWVADDCRAGGVQVVVTGMVRRLGLAVRREKREGGSASHVSIDVNVNVNDNINVNIDVNTLVNVKRPLLMLISVFCSPPI